MTISFVFLKYGAPQWPNIYITILRKTSKEFSFLYLFSTIELLYILVMYHFLNNLISVLFKISHTYTPSHSLLRKNIYLNLFSLREVEEVKWYSITHTTKYVSDLKYIILLNEHVLGDNKTQWADCGSKLLLTALTNILASNYNCCYHLIT